MAIAVSGSTSTARTARSPLSPSEARQLLAGLELADSVTLDPHKWLFQPFECGCLLVREESALCEAFAISPDYLKDTDSREVNLYDYGLQLSRSWRALKVWLSVRCFGLDAFRTAIDRGIALALHAERRIASSPAFELLSPASLGVVCFRRRFPDLSDELELAGLNAQLNAAINASGTGFLTSTRLAGEVRAAALHSQPHHDAGRRRRRPRLPRAGGARAASRRPLVHPSDGSSPSGRVASGGARSTPTSLLDVPVLASLDDDGRAAIIEIARELEVAPGETVVEQWDSSRDFYIVLEGLVEVIDGETGLARAATTWRPLRRDRRPRLGLELRLRANGLGGRAIGRRGFWSSRFPT